MTLEGTGGDFSFYDLGEPLFVGESLNSKVGTDKIREYVWFMETKEPYANGEKVNPNPYFLGRSNSTDYYFFYEVDRVTTLDYSILATITQKADGYVIYADLCTIPEDQLQHMGIIFKKIPRDIGKL